MQLLNNKLRKFKALKRNFKNDNDKKPSKTDTEMDLVYEEGISIITPSHNGEKYISKLLNSIKNQTLSYDLFEHIIVINGEPNKTTDIIEKFRENNPSINLKIIYSDIANASNARNIAIANASKKYSTLIDDDDYISPNYLEELYRNAADNRIVIAKIVDVDENYIYQGSLKHNESGILKDYYNQIDSRYYGFNACKLLPSYQLKQVEFDVNLKSGEDVVFFANLLTNYDFEVFVIPDKSDVIYYRVLRSNSVSRKPLSYKFNVEERLDVIKELNELLVNTNDPYKKLALENRIKAQTSFIIKYLINNSGDYSRVLKFIESLNLFYFPYEDLNRRLSDRLIISFSFSPYKDVSTYLMAKRINIAQLAVDVIHNNMEDIRKTDATIPMFTNIFIGNNKQINSTPTFGNWMHIKKFCEKGIENINLIAQGKEYKEIYSCNMYPASNFLAFQYKKLHNDVKWIVEFPDLSIYEVIGDVINSKINDQSFQDELNLLLENKGFPKDFSGNLFF